MKHLLVAVSVAVLLIGCGSTVKLDDVPVVDRTGTAVGAGGAGAGGMGAEPAVGKASVALIDIDKSLQPGAGPAGPKIVYFDYDSVAIKPEFQALIETHARFIKADKARKAVIEGHTDERGGREYNLALGQKRSEAVRNALGLLGVSDDQLEAVSFGKEKPAVQGSDEAAMAQNRRAEIRYR